MPTSSAKVTLYARRGAEVMEGEDAPDHSVRSIPMMAPTLVVLVRVIVVILRYHRQDVYWMVADLTFGKNFDKNFERAFEKTLGMAAKQTWIGKRIGIWSSPEGREYRVESQTTRQAPDHHPRL